jgi:L-rhamnose mutarotase/histidinol phosphatase-like PHP family hydrolase
MLKHMLSFLLLTLLCVLAWLGRAVAAEPAVGSPAAKLAAGAVEMKKPDAIDAEIARLKRAGFPMVDFHIHLKGGLTIEEAVALSRQSGIRYGVAANCGLKFPITDDRGIERYIHSLKGQPVFIGMQAEGREWPRLFSKEAIAKFDYVFSDAMTIVDHRGRRARLWVKEEVDIPDEQAFMELLVRTIENILRNEPIDIYANPTYLPEMLAKRYDQLWTPERVRRVIDAAAQSGVAIEISNRLRLPKAAFIRQAKRAGVKFTFGTNNVNHNLGRSEYGLQMIRECGLTPQDMWMPKPDGQKPVQLRKKVATMTRYGNVIGLHAEKLAEYTRLHAAVWPDVLKMIQQCNIRNYSIFLRRLPDGRHYLFSYFEYLGDDFDADMAKMAADPVTQRWWELCKPCQEPLADRGPGQWWASMEEVFHQD